MTKQRLISSLLTASILAGSAFSLGGCSLLDSDNKAVLKVAEEYAAAVAEGDAGDITDLMVDGDDFEDELETYIAAGTATDDLEDIAENIQGSISYTIDRRSVQSSKKEKRASVSVTYTIVDYQEVYEDVAEDHGDADDYADELQDCDDVVEITQTIDLVLDHGEWKVKDKRYKDIYEIYAFYDDIQRMGFGTLRAYSVREIQDILEDVLDADPNDIYNMNDEDGSGLAYYEDFYIMMEVYDDTGEARDRFYDSLADFEDMIEDEDFTGDHYEYYEGSCGYYTFNGTNTVNIDPEFMYGGIYRVDNMILLAAAMDDDADDIASVNEFLNAIGYPLP